MLSHKFQAIGTQWSIETPEPLTDAEKAKIEKVIEEFDIAFSRFRKDSFVWRAYKNAPGSFQFPDKIQPIFGIYQKLSLLTNGQINPLVGGSLEQLGYDTEYSLVSKIPTPAPIFSQTVTLHENILEFNEPALLDIGAIGKGKLVDIIAEVISENHEYYVIDGSGDIAVNSKTPEVIGLEHPADPNLVIGLIKITSGSLCASAINRRSWGNGLHHIIDAKTGKPINSDVVATWAITDTTIQADALSTALFYRSPSEVQKVFGDFNFVVMHKDGKVYHNINLSLGELFS
ncbi:MAG: FAD:protein FMN transferase [Micrococcaceae bacterium]